MSKNASAGEKPPALTDAQHTNHDDAVVVEQTHHVTPSGIETTTTVTTPTGTERISEAVADQLHLAFDVAPSDHGLTTDRDTAGAWSYADHALTRLGGEDA